MPQSMSNTLFNDAQARAAQLQLQAAAATSGGPAPELGSDGTFTYISG
jgi:membrane protease subunit (stomatin/prohibitin family)